MYTQPHLSIEKGACGTNRVKPTTDRPIGYCWIESEGHFFRFSTQKSVSSPPLCALDTLHAIDVLSNLINSCPNIDNDYYVHATHRELEVN